MGIKVRRFQRFSSLRTFYFTLDSKVLISNVDIYSLHANDIKFNVGSLTPNQITFCLAETKKH